MPCKRERTMKLRTILCIGILTVLYLCSCSPMNNRSNDEQVSVKEKIQSIINNGQYINQQDDQGCTPLHWAAYIGDINLVHLLIEIGANLNIQDFQGYTPLMNSIINKKTNLAIFLIEKGTDLNLQDHEGFTALMISSSIGDFNIASSIINNKANLDIKNSKGNVALHSAAGNGKIEIVKLLLKKGANSSSLNREGKTAGDIANENNYKEISKILPAGHHSFEEKIKPYPSAVVLPVPTLPLPSSPSFGLEKYTGTGWITEGGYIVTNQHVLEGYTQIMVRFDGSGTRACPAEVVVADENNDLAILKIDNQKGEQPKGLPIATKLPKIGAEVFTIGYPKSDVMGLNPKVTNGIVSALSGIKDDPRVIQTTVAIQSGNSGGPLLNMKGEVVGITTASLRTRVTKQGIDVPQGVNYAIKSGYASALLASVPEISYPMANPGSSSLEELIPKIKDSIVQVIVTSNGHAK